MLTQQQHDLVEKVVFSIGPISAIIAARCGVKAWLRYEMAAAFVLATALIAQPKALLAFVLNSPVKPYHTFLATLYACYLIYSVMFPLLLRNSQDESIFYGHFWARVIANTLLIVDNFISYSEGVHWNYKLLCSLTSYSIVCLLINAYFLASSKKPPSINPFEDCVNHVAKLEFFMLLSAGLVMYAFPDKFVLLGGTVSVSNESFRSMTRSCGALLLSLGFESFCVSEFIYLRDKKKFMLSHLLGSLAELVVIFVGFYCYKAYTAVPALALFLAINMSYNLLVLYGYLVTPQDHKNQSKKSN